jgi:SAM-dependent methyltransferase
MTAPAAARHGAPACRSCGAPLTRTFADLGSTPLANSYVEADALGRPDPVYPLHARVCDRCFLVQVEDAVPPEAIFSHYAYFSSYATSWVEHARRYAVTAVGRLGLSPSSLVVEIASNDGYLLQHFVAAGIPVLGVEPAANVAAAAAARGVPTEVAFFGRATAERLAAAGRHADLMVSNNVLAHVPDINDFVSGVPVLLKPRGVWTIEFPHLLNLIEQVQFDTIYHEHYSYLSLLTVEALFARHGLVVFDVEELPTHGGSLRVHAGHAAAGHPEGEGLRRVRAKEAAAGLDRPETYDGFGPRVAAIRDGLLSFLAAERDAGRTVAAYGAAAKGNTMLNVCGVDTGLIAYVVDRNPAKQGRWLPGSRLPIHPPERILETRPHTVLILPWNLRGEIMAEMAAVRGWGGRFAVAVPRLEIV